MKRDDQHHGVITSWLLYCKYCGEVASYDPQTPGVWLKMKSTHEA
jgi:hypothetical protein